MSAHTPGPWQKLFFGGDSFQIESKAQNHIADVVYVHDSGERECEANARLIAAAPEMLEALQAAERRLASEGIISGGAVDSIRAAIAKATGGDK